MVWDESFRHPSDSCVVRTRNKNVGIRLRYMYNIIYNIPSGLKTRLRRTKNIQKTSRQNEMSRIPRKLWEIYVGIIIMEKSISFDTGLPTPPPKFAFLFLIDICGDFFPADGNLRFTRSYAHHRCIIIELVQTWNETSKPLRAAVKLYIKKKIATHTFDYECTG